MAYRDPERPTGREKILALMGLPAEANPAILRRYPVATMYLLLVTSFLSLYFLYVDPEIGTRLAFIPSAPTRLRGLTLFTCFFVHGNLFHLFSNMYCLYVFGDNVEDDLGIPRYLGLVATATLVGSLLSGAISHLDSIPHVGASGGIFGVMVYYLLRFPRAQFTYFFLFHFFRVRAWAVLLFYTFLQMSGALDQLRGAGDVDHLAHIGGGLMGLFFWFYQKRREALVESPPPNPFSP